MAKFKHRRQAEEKPRRRKGIGQAEVFDHEERSVEVRDGKPYKIKKLFVRSSSGEIREYGKIREINKKPLIKFTADNSIPEGVSIIGELEKHEVLDSLAREKARGVLIRIGGAHRERYRTTIKKAQWKKVKGIRVKIFRRVKIWRTRSRVKGFTSRIILDRKKLNKKGYLAEVIAGKVQAHLKAKGFRLSSRKISKAKRARQLNRVTFSVNIFY